MPLVPQSFSQIIDFTRTSAATYVANTGFVTQTPASRNLLTFTQEFDNAAWSKANSSIVANAATAPDGTTTADRLLDNSSSTVHSAFQQITVTANTTYTLSFYAKASGRNWVTLDPVYPTVANNITYFDLANGTVGTSDPDNSNVTITAVGDGWYRCSLRHTTAVGQTLLNFQIAPANANNGINYLGNGTDGVLIWGAQLEAASAASTYTRNNGGVYPPRFDYDPVTLAPRGLLIEEQRTNLLTYSEQFDGPSWTPTNLTVTANSTASPDGTVDADTLNEGTASGVHSIAQVFSATTGTSYAFSVYLKNGDARYAQLFFGSAGHGSTAFANFDLQSGTVGTVGATATASIQSAGGGWYRCTIVASATATTASASAQIGVITSITSARAENYTGASKFIYVWGIQTEAGAFATSYIPTVASQVTRTADVAAINAPNFASWYNQSEGTLVLSGSVLGAPAAATVSFAQLSNGVSNSSEINLGMFGLSAPLFGVNDGTTQANLDLGSMSAGQIVNMAGAYKVNDFAGVLNGGTVQTDTAGSVPTGLVQLGIGFRLGGVYMNGHIRRIRYYPTRLSNTQLQALTA